MNQGIFQTVCNVGEVDYFADSVKRRVKKGEVVTMSQKLYSQCVTHKQLKLAHMWFSEVAEHYISRGKKQFKNGNDINKMTMKDALKSTYLRTELTQNVETGEAVHISSVSLSDLNLEEMCEFLRKVETYANKRRIRLTRPEDKQYEQYIQQWEAQHG